MKRIYNRIGEKFEKLTIIGKKKIKNDNHIYWICLCECGNIHTVSSRHWKEIKSCGCLSKEKNKNKYSNTKLYYTWKSMKARCYNSKNPSYKNYGARGIIVCEEWKNNFLNFYNWATNNGYDYNKTRKQQTLDRININGNYEPNNCRWANSIVQGNNTSRNVFLIYNNNKKTIAEWSRILKINYKKFYLFIRKEKEKKNGRRS